MKKMRGMALFMSLVIVLGMVQGCGKKDKGNDGKVLSDVNFPLEETVTYDIVGKRYAHSKPYDSYADWNKQFEDASNVKVNWVDWGVDETYNQKLNLAFASEDLPDAVYGLFCIGMDGLAKYGEAGLIIPLEDLISKYMPNLSRIAEKNPEILQDMVTPDGHIYAIPAYDPNGMEQLQETLLYNKAWLDKLGMEIPTTTEEFYNYLKAIKAAGDLNGNGKNDEIPFTFRLGTAGALDHQNGICSFVGFTGRVLPQNSFTIEKGKTVYTPATDEFKESVKYLNKLYSEGLIDKEVFTMDSTTYNGRIKSKDKNVGVCIAPNAESLNSVLGDDTFVYGPPLKDENGNSPKWFRRVTPANFRIAFFITNKAKNPEILLKWLDLHFEKDISLENKIGKWDVKIKKTDDGKIKYLTKPDGTNYTAQELAEYMPAGAAYNFAIGDYELAEKSKSTLSYEKALEIYEPYLLKKEQVFYQNVFTPEEGEIRTHVIPEVESYMIQNLAKWITKGGVEEEWNGYLKQLDILGIKDWTGVMQAAYDRSLKK